MQRRVNPREAKRMMQRMGMSMDAVADVQEVVIKTSSKEIKIEEPEVAVLEVQ
jgi:NACalpha-BTF3-like transcription factor